MYREISTMSISASTNSGFHVLVTSCYYRVGTA